MRMTKLIVGLLMALLVGSGAAVAGTDLNEVGALLVYPVVVGVQGQETYITITNAGGSVVVAHLSMINGQALLANGDPNPEYCDECDVPIILTGNDTETLVVTDQIGGGLRIFSLDGTTDTSCQYPFGFFIVTLEAVGGGTLTDNVLLGEEIVVDYVNGAAYSIPAIPFQGKGGGDGNRMYGFDDVEYGKLPRIVAADFIAPDPNPGITADLALFTLGFDRQIPPTVDCSITGFDAFENPFSNSFFFGCWAFVDLIDIQTEFAYPNLGQFGQLDEHGWLQLSCRVDANDDGTFDGFGGVHGALVQTMANGAVIRRNAPVGPAINGNAAWARALYQSVTAGDPFTLFLENPPGGLN